jgi:superfamily II RNA helicase
MPFFKNGRLYQPVIEYVKEQRSKRRYDDSKKVDFGELISDLRELNLTPAIIFLKSRSDCDRALENLPPCPKHPLEDGFADLVREYVEPYPELRNQRQLGKLLSCRAGSHHAGQLPSWRLLIEKTMQAGFLDVIFSTSTVAAGVNFPARTVVILQSDRFNGSNFVDITATDLHQMTGRAGRRGMDNAGYVLIVPGKFVDIPLLKTLFTSKPEPLESRITVNFSMTLNLLLSHDRKSIDELLSRSFAAFRENPKRAKRVTFNLQNEFQKHVRLLQELEYVDDKGIPTYDGRWAAQLRLDHPLIIAELIREGQFDGLQPDELAALISPFVIDKDKDIVISREAWDRTRKLWNKFKGMIAKLKPIAHYMVDQGFDVPPLMFWPATSTFLWAQDIEWDELTTHVSADEGDLAMLTLRTADHLRQLISLEREKPELAHTARKAIELIMRVPLVG